MWQCFHAFDVQNDDDKQDNQTCCDGWQSAQGVPFRIALNEGDDEQKDDEQTGQNERTDKLKLRWEKLQQFVKPKDIKVGVRFVGNIKRIGTGLKGGRKFD